MKLRKEVWFIIICLVLSVGLFLVFKPSDGTKTKKGSNDSKPSGSGKDKPTEEVVKDKKMSLVMVGDTLIHGAVYYDASPNYSGQAPYDFSKMLTHISEYIKDYDLKYFNQESIIGGKAIGLSHYPRLNSPEEIGEDMVAAGFNMVSLANNHSFDKGDVGLVNSINFWKTQNIITAGQYASEEEQKEVPIHEKNGIKFAFLSYTTVTNGLSASEPYYVNVYSNERVKEDVTKARQKGAEVVIVAMHWGAEYTHEPVDEEVTIAKYLSELGVDLVIGTHPHVIQPIAYVGNTLVIYSLGNFLSAQHELGQEKIIGLTVGLDIVVDKDGKVKFENIKPELNYTYCTWPNGYHNFSVYQFSQLDDSILPNYKSIEEKYMQIVHSEGV
ncbi:MAG: CapA family protein [Bacilli bacterium]|nr:CapA family protein [Bacilli bacterium]